MSQRIRIHTESVLAAGRRFAAAADHLAEIGGQLQNAIGSLDVGAWDGISRSRAEPILAQVQPHSHRLTQGVEALGRQLARAAQTFEERDRTVARDVEELPWLDWRGGGRFQPGRGSQRGDEPPDFHDVVGGQGAAYAPVAGQPFLLGTGDGGDIHPSDVDQGAIGDCYFMASLAAMAQQNPEAIRRMIRTNDDGTYTVTLYRRNSPLAFWEPRFEPVEVVVTADFPLRDGVPVFAQPGDSANGEREIWAMLIEKAFAKSEGSYGAIVSGWGHQALDRLTGVPSEWHSPRAISFSDLADHFEAGHAITAGSLADYRLDIGELHWDISDAAGRNPLYQNDTLHASHEYYVSGIDRTAQTVSLRNPWGWQEPEITISFEELRSSFRRVSINPITP